MSNKVSILMTTMEYDIIKVGGLSAALTSLADAMKKYAEVNIILPKSGVKLPWKKVGERLYSNMKMEIFDHNSVKVYTLSNDVLDEEEVYPEPANEKAIRKIDEFCKCLCRVINEINFDIVHMHDFFAYKAMDKFKAMGKPVLLTIHRLHREYPNWFAGEKMALEKADYITVVGESYYKEDEKELFEKYKDKVTCVFNGIDTEFWNAQKSSYPNISRKERRKIILQKYGLSDEVFYVYVGRFDPVQKGVNILLDASAQFLKEENVRMIIVGAGDKKLENLSKELEAKYPSKLMVMNKLLPKEEVRDLYSSADFALVPSIFEPFGLVQLEAMSCGCIPIGSRTGGIKDTVISYENDKQKATGFLVEKGNPKALLNTMKMALAFYRENPKVIERMRKNGRERCEKIFQWDVSSRRYLDIYKKLLKSSERGDDVEKSVDFFF